jgi:hypothetical protein
MEHHVKGHGVGTFYYCSPQWDLSNGLLRDPKGDHMEKLLPLEANIPTYHFWVQNIISVSSSMVMFRVHHIWRNGGGPFPYSSPQ